MTGIREVIVQSFPEETGSRAQISSGGGSDPLWSADSRTVLYLRPSDESSAVMAVDFNASSTLVVGRPRELFLPRPAKIAVQLAAMTYLGMASDSCCERH